MTIEKYLVLNKYLLSLFGVNDIKDLLNELKNKSEDEDSDGRSYFVNALRGIKDIKISEDKLLIYDKNIQEYVKKINFKREHIKLKYFQYLAVLFTEIFLDNFKNGKSEFLWKLNEFLKKYKEQEEIKIIDSFNEDDLRKIAFWMATGSGKTLIMHINYYQFLNYNLFSPDNIILITPNAELSKQHFGELQKSGIPCRCYTENPSIDFKRDNEVLVIEITKFVEEKKGGGVTLPVEVFEGRNLIFVDEGHKGKKSEEQKWAKLRNTLAENGFVFEYSATFGQILSEKQPEILKEYAKSIIFDYSYKYFYLDGYGKDFSVLDVREIKISEKEFQEGMFVANLLSFYEQILVYEENKELAKEYNLEKPLWIFVGTTVIKGKNKKKQQKESKEEKQTISDVIQIVKFLKRVIDDENWVKKWIDKIMNGKTNLKNKDGNDIFQNKFQYLRKKDIINNIEDLYKRIFGGKGTLHLNELKNAEGEIGLKISENEYFGVIYIGDISGFKKQLEKEGILVEQDVTIHSLFDNIKEQDSKINILIGSKKFIEGWDTPRVSSMGLLNIGKGQGPQIIQLFGRGVRLKGKGMSLKRSGENSEVQVLETLNIYGIKADYLTKFLEAIRREEVEFETINIPVKLHHQDKWNTLFILSKPKKKFEEEEILKLEIDDRINYTVDLLPKIAVYTTPENREEGIDAEKIASKGKELRFPKDKIDLLNWERIWQEIMEFKSVRNYWNLVFDREILKKILLAENYNLYAPSETFEVKSTKDIEELENIALHIIKKYLDLFYSKKAKHFETENLFYDKLKQIPLPYFYISEKKQQGYIIQVDKKKKELINKIKNLANDLNTLLKEELKEDKGTLLRIYFDNSLYVPILLQTKEIDKISPAGLVESEKKFVLELREFLKSKKDKLSIEVYLLRNLPFSGVGFQLEWAKFYPDFIMWVKKDKQQIIIFIEPKSLEYIKGLNDEKIQFHKEIKELEKKLNKKDIKLESFILSKTSYNELIKGMKKYPSKDEYINNHVIFLEDEDWPKKLFGFILKS